MAKCKVCGKKNAEFRHYDGRAVCDNCLGTFFTCPTCGLLFDHDDYEHGDAGTGFCVACAKSGD